MAFRAPLFVGKDTAGNGLHPQDARLALSYLAPGVGVLSGCTVTGMSGAATTYSIAAGAVALARGALGTDGVYITPNDGAATVTTGLAAPGSGSRYDLIYVAPRNSYDGGFADTTVMPLVAALAGTSAASPARPYGSLPPGALVLAEALVPAGAGSAAAGSVQIVQTAPLAPGIMQRQLVDWNTAVAPGFYWGPVGTTANAPDTANGFSGLVVTNSSGTVIVQTIFRMSTTGEQWTRQSSNSGASWTVWRRTIGDDTGWVPLTSVANYTNAALVRRVGNVVRLRGTVTRDQGAIQGITTVANLPGGGYAPAFNVYVPLYMYSSPTVVGQLMLQMDAGTTGLQVFGNGAGYSIARLGGISWTTD